MQANLLASFSSVMSTIGYVLLAILVLLVMITVHEFGHYIMGKIFKFKIEEFAIGFGPKIFSKTKKNGEKFSIRLFPLGGFCSFAGEDEDLETEGAFNKKHPFKRIMVLISGALMNYILALIIICITFGAYGRSALLVCDVQNDQTYISYSLQEGDAILEVNGKKTYMLTDIMPAIENKKEGDIVDFTIFRDGKIQNVEVKLRQDTNFANLEDISTLCKSLGAYTEKDGQKYSSFLTTGVRLGFFQTIGESFNYSFKLASTIFSVIGQLFTGRLGISSMGGTITTISMTAEGIKTGGLWFLLNMTSLIGVNLAVFNLLPIPALDGSRVVFTLIEWIRKKPLNRKVEGAIHMIGLVLLLLFSIFIDLQRCF